jgi:hypothetical protein
MRCFGVAAAGMRPRGAAGGLFVVFEPAGGHERFGTVVGLPIGGGL